MVDQQHQEHIVHMAEAQCVCVIVPRLVNANFTVLLLMFEIAEAIISRLNKRERIYSEITHALDNAHAAI